MHCLENNMQDLGLKCVHCKCLQLGRAKSFLQTKFTKIFQEEMRNRKKSYKPKHSAKSVLLWNSVLFLHLNSLLIKQTFTINEFHIQHQSPCYRSVTTYNNLWSCHIPIKTLKINHFEFQIFQIPFRPKAAAVVPVVSSRLQFVPY